RRMLPREGKRVKCVGHRDLPDCDIGFESAGFSEACFIITIAGDAIQPLVYKQNSLLGTPLKIAHGTWNLMPRGELIALERIGGEIAHAADDECLAVINKIERTGFSLLGC